MTMKYIGILLLFSCSSLFGIYKGSALKNRVLELFEIIKFINKVKLEISYQALTIKEILSSCEDKLPLLQKIKQAYEKNNQSDINTIINNSENAGSLLKSDTNLLSRFFEILGTTNTEEQIANCNISIIEFEKALVQAKETAKQKQKMYRTLGVLCGLMIAVVLI